MVSFHSLKSKLIDSEFLDFVPQDSQKEIISYLTEKLILHSDPSNKELDKVLLKAYNIHKNQYLENLEKNLNSEKNLLLIFPSCLKSIQHREQILSREQSDRNKNYDLLVSFLREYKSKFNVSCFENIYGYPTISGLIREGLVDEVYLDKFNKGNKHISDLVENEINSNENNLIAGNLLPVEFLLHRMMHCDRTKFPYVLKEFSRCYDLVSECSPSKIIPYTEIIEK